MDLTWEAPLLGEVERLLKHPGPRLRGVAPGSTPPVVTLHPVACIGSGADRQPVSVFSAARAERNFLTLLLLAAV